MSEHKLQSRPPSPKSQKELEDARKRFIMGEDEPVKKVTDEIYPWEAPYVRNDVKKLFSLRLSEPEMLKLQYIHKKTGKSMHQICLDAVLPAIEEAIKSLTEES